MVASQMSTCHLVYPVSFVPELTWVERIQRCKFPTVDPEVWHYIDKGKFVPVVDEDVAAVNVLLPRLDCELDSKAAEAVLEEDGYQPISPARFLHLCEKRVDFQLHLPLICLNVICTSQTAGDQVLGVWEDQNNGGGCRLSLFYYSSCSREGYGFPSVCK